MKIFTLSAKTGSSMNEWIDWLKERASVKENEQIQTAAIAGSSPV